VTLADPSAALALAENHFAFMAAQRGTIRRTPDSIELTGRADFLSWWTPLTRSAELPQSARCVRLFPWTAEAWPGRLRDLGFTAAGQLSYMEAPIRPGDAVLADDVAIAVVRSDEDAVAFAQTQAAGFEVSDDSPDDSADDAGWWRGLFREVAVGNYADPAQTFYLLRCDGVPAAVSLTVATPGLTGIYAVATLPAYRRRGFANLLLQRIRQDADHRGDAKLTLQVDVGSDAERLYRTAGFTSSFVSTLYER
jgi:GNAT superfamily N-acetyltransferase